MYKRQGQASTEDFNRAARTFSSNYDGARLTIVDQSGRVVGDSHEDPATMENHGDREEIAEAKESGVGVSERWSDTLKGRLRYVAVQADNGYIYRASVRVRSLNQAFVSILPAAIISILAAVLFSAPVSYTHLVRAALRLLPLLGHPGAGGHDPAHHRLHQRKRPARQIGRASCRERV